MIKLDRLARSVGDLLDIVARLEAQKVSPRALSMSSSQPLDTGTTTGRLMLSVIGAVRRAEWEHEREGIAKAKREAATRAVCRPLGARLTNIRLKEEGVRPSEIASKLGIGRGQRLSGAG